MCSCSAYLCVCDAFMYVRRIAFIICVIQARIISANKHAIRIRTHTKLQQSGEETKDSGITHTLREHVSHAIKRKSTVYGQYKKTH